MSDMLTTGGMPALKPGEMTLEFEGSWWHLTFAKQPKAATPDKPVVKQAYYSQAQLVQLIQLAMARLGARMEPEAREEFLEQIRALMNPPSRTAARKAKAEAPKPATAAHPTITEAAAAAGRGGRGGRSRVTKS
jgi:hypothetical protein